MDAPIAEPWQLEYFVEAIARGLCFAEAGGCAGLIDFDQDQLEALARREDVRARLALALRNRLGGESDLAMIRAEAWARYISCVSRKADAPALQALKYYAELGGVAGKATRDDLSKLTDAELRAEISSRQDRLRLVRGGGA